MEVFCESLYEAVEDCLKVVPILFLAYLLVSFISHDHSHRFSRFLSKNSKSSVFYSSLLGCVPQCGFSSVIADLYSQRRVSLGTLIAVFVATSDEAIPIMLSHSDSIVSMLELIGIKLLLAIFWGYLIDLCFALHSKGRRRTVLSQDVHGSSDVKEHKFEHDHESEHSHDEVMQSHDNDGEILHEKTHAHVHECGHIHSNECEVNCGHSHGSCCGNNIFVDAFDHTLNIIVYIFVATFVLNLIIGYCGTDVLSNLLTTNSYLQILIAGLIGLIPNCAASVLLTELFIYGSLSFPALLAGLTAGAGVGLIILWTKNRRHPIKNLGILVLQYAIGIASGFLVSLFM